MAEFSVTQRSVEWFELRSSVCLTASHFGDALGVGRGKPYDFLRFIFAPVDQDLSEEENEACKQGCELEPLIDRAYQRLTGRKTLAGGFWVATESQGVLSGLVGASPDAKVYVKDDKGIDSLTGLAEYKAPLYKIYSRPALVGTRHCVPRRYMAQMHGQMALCGLSWCDFMAVCHATREILLCRVRFSTVYWQSISRHLYNFCLIVQEARLRRKAGVKNLFDFDLAQDLRLRGMHQDPFDGEMEIIVENLVETRESVLPSVLSSHGSINGENLDDDNYHPRNNNHDYVICDIVNDDVKKHDDVQCDVRNKHDNVLGLGREGSDSTCAPPREQQKQEQNNCERNDDAWEQDDNVDDDDSICDIDLDVYDIRRNCGDGDNVSVCHNYSGVGMCNELVSASETMAVRTTLGRRVDPCKSFLTHQDYKSDGGQWMNYESLMILDSL